MSTDREYYKGFYEHWANISNQPDGIRFNEIFVAIIESVNPDSKEIIPIVKFFLEKYPNGNFSDKSSEQTSILHRACKKACAEVVDLLLSYPGLDPNVMEGGETAFYSVCSNLTSNNFVTFVVMLNNPRVDITLPTVHGTTPLVRLFLNNSEMAIKFWTKSDRGCDLPGTAELLYKRTNEFRNSIEAVTIIIGNRSDHGKLGITLHNLYARMEQSADAYFQVDRLRKHLETSQEGELDWAMERMKVAE